MLIKAFLIALAFIVVLASYGWLSRQDLPIVVLFLSETGSEEVFNHKPYLAEQGEAVGYIFLEGPVKLPLYRFNYRQKILEDTTFNSLAPLLQGKALNRLSLARDALNEERHQLRRYKQSIKEDLITNLIWLIALTIAWAFTAKFITFYQLKRRAYDEKNANVSKNQ